MGYNTLGVAMISSLSISVLQLQDATLKRHEGTHPLDYLPITYELCSFPEGLCASNGDKACMMGIIDSLGILLLYNGCIKVVPVESLTQGIEVGAVQPQTVHYAHS